MASAMPSIGRPPASHARATLTFRTSAARKGRGPSRGTRIPHPMSRSTSEGVMPALAASAAGDSSFGWPVGEGDASLMMHRS